MWWLIALDGHEPKWGALRQPHSHTTAWHHTAYTYRHTHTDIHTQAYTHIQRHILMSRNASHSTQHTHTHTHTSEPRMAREVTSAFHNLFFAARGGGGSSLLFSRFLDSARFCYPALHLLFLPSTLSLLRLSDPTGSKLIHPSLFTESALAPLHITLTAQVKEKTHGQQPGGFEQVTVHIKWLHPKYHQKEASDVICSVFQECSSLYNYEEESVLKHSHAQNIGSSTMSARRCTVGFCVVKPVKPIRHFQWC